MNRLAVLSLVCSSFLGALATAQVSTLTDTQVADLIAQIKNMPAARLEKGLPATRLADWLQAQTGPEGKIGWAFRHDPAVGTRGLQAFPDSVEADGALKDGRTFFVMIDVSDPRRPRVRDVEVMSAIDLMEETNRLRDLPHVLSRN